MSYSLEKVNQIWDNELGDRIEVGPDRDGLDLIEIRYVNPDGEVQQGITLRGEQVNMVIEALKDYKMV